MDLFDPLVQEIFHLLEPLRPAALPPCPPARSGDPNELILRRDMAFELGEGSFPSVSITTITQDPALVPGDGVFLIGSDLGEIRGDCAFTRISILRTDDIYAAGDQAAYNLIKTLEGKKFQVSPQGYMVRASAMNNREQVRVSKTAIKKGLSFGGVGQLLLNTYHENRHVEAAAVYFITLPSAPYAALDTIAERIGAVTKTLNHALADVSMDCRACEWKPVCDTVEGLRELHQKTIQTKEEIS